jgi:FKBP-type peptidyl-prolyl cis-trans isomerase 2
MTKLKEKDFIEVEFTGRTVDGEIFDSNIKKDLEEAQLKGESKPFIFSLGQGMFMKGIDDFLVGKEVGETYKIELQPENAFGMREAKAIQMIPIKIFRQHKINPVAGIAFNFDGRMAKVLSVSGGRVMTDFNHPLAGKVVSYEVKVTKQITDQNEKVKAFNEFLFKRDIEFEIKDKSIVLKLEKPMVQFAEMFKDKFKEIFGLDLVVEEKKTATKSQ